jgi:hypothetical protein
VLVSGGYNESFSGLVVPDAEILDPAAGSWSSTGPLRSPRLYHESVLLPDGRVLLAGGVWDYFTGLLSSAELFDPADGSWSPTGNMSEGRSQYSLTLLEDGRAIAVGGFNLLGPLATAEIYDPLTGTWQLTEPLAVPRLAHSATLLRDGSVLVAGGSATDGNSGPIASAEAYHPRDCVGAQPLCELAQVRQTAYERYVDLVRRFAGWCYGSTRPRAADLALELSGLGDQFRSLERLPISADILYATRETAEAIDSHSCWLIELSAGWQAPFEDHYDFCRVAELIPESLRGVRNLVAMERDAWDTVDAEAALAVLRAQEAQLIRQPGYDCRLVGPGTGPFSPRVLAECMRLNAREAAQRYPQAMATRLLRFLEKDLAAIRTVIRTQ